MTERNEMDKICQTFEVTLGGKQYTLPIKPILPMREFRKRIAELARMLVGELAKNPETIAGIAAAAQEKKETAAPGENGKEFENLFQAFGPLLPVVISDGLDALIEMLWAYAPELREHETEANEEEIVGAAMEVLEIALPLVGRLVLASVKHLDFGRK